MPGILFVHGDADFARDMFRRERRGNWSRALEVVLEKHGYLGYERAGPQAIAEPGLLEGFDAVLVGRIPESLWTPSTVEEIVSGSIPVLVEGPPPASVEQALGVTREGPLADTSGQVADGLVLASDEELIEASKRFSSRAGGPVTKAYSWPIDLKPGWHWSSVPGVPLTAEQAAAWRRPGWDAVRWRESHEGGALADWLPFDGTPPSPAIVRRGRLWACSFGLLGFLGQRHTADPYTEGELRCGLAPIGVEALLLGLIDLMHRQSGATRTRVLPWPLGVRWIRSVRHDFDRSRTQRQVARVVRRHRRAGTVATWYWRALRADPASLRPVVRTAAHEVALHTEHVWRGGDDERRRVEAAAGQPVLGTAAHGFVDSFCFQGAPNVLWAASRGMSYTEMLESWHLHPFRFPALAADGAVEVLGIVCLPHHESFDISMRRNDIAADRIRRAPEFWARHRGFLQVMNHPDIHVRRLFRVLSRMPSQGRADWVARDVAAWWRKTHFAGEVELQPVSRSLVRLRSRAGVERLVVESVPARGPAVERAVDLPAGGWRELRLDRAAGS